MKNKAMSTFHHATWKTDNYEIQQTYSTFNHLLNVLNCIICNTKQVASIRRYAYSEWVNNGSICRALWPYFTVDIGR